MVEDVDILTIDIEDGQKLIIRFNRLIANYLHNRLIN